MLDVLQGGRKSMSGTMAGMATGGQVTGKAVGTPDNRRSQPALAPDGTKYLVAAVKKGMPFNERSGSGGAGGPIDWLASGLLDIVLSMVMDSRGDRSSTWKVGVKRFGRLGWERFVHKEVLAPGLDPAQRMERAQ